MTQPSKHAIDANFAIRRRLKCQDEYRAKSDEFAEIIQRHIDAATDDLKALVCAMWVATSACPLTEHYDTMAKQILAEMRMKLEQSEADK